MDSFGLSVSTRCDTVVVGASRDDNHVSAHIFSRDQSDADAWGQVAKISASDGADWDFFGESVATSCSNAVIGAPEGDELGSDAGSAYVFRFGHDLFVDGFETGDTAEWSVSEGF